MPASTFLGNAILDAYFRNERVYISAHTGNPGLNGANEVSTSDWPAYVRRDPSLGGSPADGFSAAASKKIANLLDIFWPDHDGVANVTITYFGIWTASSAGNFKFGKVLRASKTVQPGDQCVFRAGEIELEVD